MLTQQSPPESRIFSNYRSKHLIKISRTGACSLDK